MHENWRIGPQRWFYCTYTDHDDITRWPTAGLGSNFKSIGCFICEVNIFTCRVQKFTLDTDRNSSVFIRYSSYYHVSGSTFHWLRWKWLITLLNTSPELGIPTFSLTADNLNIQSLNLLQVRYSNYCRGGLKVFVNFPPVARLTERLQAHNFVVR